MVALPDGRVVLFGGNGENGLHNDLFIFENSSWNAVAPANIPPSPLANHSAAVSNSQMYAFGGWGSPPGIVFGDMSAYNLQTRKWTQPCQQGDSPGPRFMHSMVSLPDGTLLVFGGLDQTGSLTSNWVFRCNPTTGTWERLAFHPRGSRYGHSAAFYGGKMYIWGGNDLSQNLNDMWVYDPEKDEWSEVLQPGGEHEAAGAGPTCHVWL